MSVMTTKTPPTAARLMTGQRVWLLLGALTLAAGGYAFWKYETDPPRPWLVRWRLERYLKKQAHTSDLKVDFPFPSKAEMAQASPKSKDKSASSKSSQTGKDFETLRNEYFA